MKALSNDTRPDAEKIQIEIIRCLPSWRKAAMVSDLNNSVKAFAKSGLERRHPDASPEQIRRMLAELALGSELAKKVYDRA